MLLPQALRVIIPPLTNQYLNLTKNSSLAVAVGYPDLVSISNTTLEPDRARRGVHRRHHGGVSHAVARHRGADELVQRALGDPRALTFDHRWTPPSTRRSSPARRPGAQPGRWRGFARTSLAGWKSTLATLVVVAVIARLLPDIIDWAVVRAVTQPDNAACRALDHSGACWGVIAEKYRLILFGRYPFDEQWRPLIATLLMVVMLIASCTRVLWSRWLIVAWLVVLAVFFVLMRGGVAGLTPVETARWGGVPLTMLLSTLSIAAAFPIAILVALGRRSHLPAIRTLCIVYVELIRGVPLISVLFMASFMFPLFMPPGITVDVLVRVLVGITLFAAAYLAEVVRAAACRRFRRDSSRRRRRWASPIGRRSARSSCRRRCAWWCRPS